MFNIAEKDQQVLCELGARLKTLRLQRNESQAQFAQRIGISRVTYAKMEKGEAQTPVGYWLKASSLLNRVAEWDQLYEHHNLFELYEFQQSQQKRAKKRVSRKVKHVKT